MDLWINSKKLNQNIRMLANLCWILELVGQVK
jgi:hypothetical protein